MMQQGKRARWWTHLLLVAALALSTTPASAGGDDDDDLKYSSKWSKTYTKKGEGSGHRLSVPVVDTDFLGMAEWTRNQIRAPQAHAHATGAGITVAVLDGGFNLAHPDIAANLASIQYDAIDHDGDATDYGNGLDDDGDGFVDGGLGHGTFVASMVLMAAPDATILPVRIRDDEGWGSNSELLMGLKYAYYGGADIINISGGVYEPDIGDIADLIDYLRDEGIAVIVSAGNGGHDDLHGLADLYDVMPVGAVNAADQTVPWSDYADDGDMLCAPGDELYGALGFPLVADSGYWSGTSFSAGLVSGAAALALEEHGTLSVYTLFNLLEDATDDVFDSSGSEVDDFGRINLMKVITWDD